MPDRSVPFTQALGFTRLFQDFINEPKMLSGFFPAMPVERRVGLLGGREFPRERMVDILTRQNHAWGAPQAVREAISRLKDRRSVIVFAGQQTGLFGGPYLVLFKALAATKRAGELESELGVPVIPIFWAAADDHDLEEISSVALFDSAGRLERLAVDFDATAARPPVGRLAYDESIARETARLAGMLPDNDFKEAAMAAITEIYRPGLNIADCFARYLHALVGRFGIPVFNPCDDDFKKEAAPFFKEVLDKRPTIKKTLAETEAALEGSGYHIQVKKAADAVHLFFHDPDRRAIHYDSGRYVAGNAVFDEKALRGTISDRPGDFSSDVITRLLLQSYFFPTAGVFGGPAEIAYMAQMYPLFEVFDLVPPAVYARPSATILETRFERQMETYGLSLEDLAGDIEAVISERLQETFPKELSGRLSLFASEVREELNRLGEELISFDGDLKGMVNKTGERIDFQIAELEKKVFAAHRKKNKTARERLVRLGENLCPDRAPAERSVAAVYFLSRYGERIIDFLYEKLALDETGHQLITLSDYNG